MLSIVYFIIITIFVLILLYALLTRKEKFPVLVCLAIVTVVFALRALHIK